MSRRATAAVGIAIWLSASSRVAGAEQVVARATAAGDGADAPEKKPDGFAVRRLEVHRPARRLRPLRRPQGVGRVPRGSTRLAESKQSGMVRTDGGFLVPGRRRVRESLASLPPEGKQAFRLFYDPKVRQLLEPLDVNHAAAGGASGAAPPDELAILREAFDRYFITSAGDAAADRLATPPSRPATSPPPPPRGGRGAERPPRHDAAQAPSAREARGGARPPRPAGGARDVAPRRAYRVRRRAA